MISVQRLRREILQTCESLAKKGRLLGQTEIEIQNAEIARMDTRNQVLKYAPPGLVFDIALR